MTLSALIFDVDGTLAETEDLHRQAFNETFREFGLGWHWDRDQYRELLQVTGGKERMKFFAELQMDCDRRALIDQIPTMHVAKTARYTSSIKSGAVTLRPGIADLIAEARSRGLRLAIATTTTLANVEALIESAFDHSLKDPFDVIAAGDEVARKKPAPDIYILALERLGLSADDCLAIEDSENGLRSALAAGLQTIVTVSRYTADQDFCGAALVLPSMKGVGLADLEARPTSTPHPPSRDPAAGAGAR